MLLLELLQGVPNEMAEHSKNLREVLKVAPGSGVNERIQFFRMVMSKCLRLPDRYSVGGPCTRSLRESESIRPRLFAILSNRETVYKGINIRWLEEQEQHTRTAWIRQNCRSDTKHAMDPENLKRALTQAAEQGDQRAKYLLALELSNGTAEERDLGMRLLQEAAENGENNAQCTLGIFYCVGFITPKDRTRAAFWFRKAEMANVVAVRALRYLEQSSKSE